jgi:putative ABC transport system substrate-binding protein
MKRLQQCWATLQRSRRERFLALAEHARSWYSKFLHRRRLAAITCAVPDGLAVPGDPFFDSIAPRLVAFAAERRLPTIYGIGSYATQGGLMSYSVNIFDVDQRAAGYVDRILKGAKPGDLPVEQPTKFELIINLKTAKTLGLTIPESLLLRADRVIR